MRDSIMKRIGMVHSAQQRREESRHGAQQPRGEGIHDLEQRFESSLGVSKLLRMQVGHLP